MSVVIRSGEARHTLEKTPKTKKEKFVILLKGISMGVADIIPGVSGGTLALVTGIYGELVTSLSKIKISHLADLLRSLNFLPMAQAGKAEIRLKKREEAVKNLKEINWGFLVPLFLGIILAIFSMSRIISWLLNNYPLHCRAFFFGLILFSVWIPLKEASINLRTIFASLLSAVIMFLLLDESLSTEGSKNLFYIFLCGVIAISAMILPGISGSYLLVILGAYEFILQALNDFNLKILTVFIAGIGTGLYSFVRLLKFLLDKHHTMTMAVMSGIMAGSLRKLWPYSELTREFSSLFHIQTGMLIIAGGVLILLLEFSKKGATSTGR